MPPKKKANGYKMPDPLPKGEIIKDIQKREWKLGKSIGKGGFGEIYETQDKSSGGTNYPYVMKIEPHQNGPLFVEMNFYMRVAKKEHISDFMKSRGLKRLGFPPYISSGSHEYKGEKYRFLVMEKYGQDLWKYYLENNKKFPESTVYKVGLQVLDALEYMHSKDYIHADIKGANILLGLSKNNDQVYLVDFGLATKFTTAAEFKPDPKRAHDGTIEYLSRDSHKGVPTRRGDLEILFYNLVHWLGCKLPWESCLGNPKAVEQSKEKHMEQGSILTTCFLNQEAPKAIVEYYNYLKKLKFNEKPDYDKLRNILKAGLKTTGDNENSPLVFSSTSTKKTPMKRKSGVGAKKEESASKKPKKNDVKEEDDEEIKENKPKRGRKPKKLLRPASDDEEVEEEVKATPKKRGRKPKNPPNVVKPESEDEEDTKENGNDSNSDSGQSTVSETAEMQRLRAKIEQKKNAKKPTKTTAKKANGTPKKISAASAAAKEKINTPTRERLKRNAKQPTSYEINGFDSDIEENEKDDDKEEDDDIISESDEEERSPRKPLKQQKPRKKQANSRI